MTNSEYVKAVGLRHSRRAYKNKPLSEDVKSIIREMAEAVNELSEAKFTFIDDATPAFRLFTGKFSMLVVTGPDSQKGREDAGYYGESIVLQCVYHGLSTCWVGGTYNENKVYEMLDIPKDKRLYCVITIGNTKERYTAIESTVFRTTHKKSKSYQDMFEYSDKKLPEEYANGMKLVEEAPSSVNRRPVKFRYENGVLSVHVDEPYSDKSIELGIVKLHFLLGVREKGLNGKWSYANTFEETKAEILKFENKNASHREED